MNLKRRPLVQKLKIGIVGSGMVGGTLGGVWVKSGHELMFSSLNVENDKALAARLGANARAGTAAWARERGAGLASAELLPGGKYLMPGTPLAGEHSPAEIRRIAATLKK